MSRDEVNARTSEALLQAFSPIDPTEMERDVESVVTPVMVIDEEAQQEENAHDVDEATSDCLDDALACTF